MRKLATPVLLLLAAACSDYIRVEPSNATIAVGQTVTLTAYRIPSSYQGIPRPPNRIEFGGEGAVSAAGVMEARDSVASIVVQGVAPGVASIVSRHTDVFTPGLITIPVATVTVYACPGRPTLDPQFATIQGFINERVLLHVESSSDGGTYQWYTGARGDASHPILFTNAPSYFDFVPHANGSYSFWVRETSVCGTAEAAFVVNVGNPQRRRAAGH